MNSTRIALYDITSGTFDEIADKARAGMVPLFEKSPGFLSYGVAQVHDTMFASVSTWRTHEQAEAANATAADWVKANLADRFTLRELHVGDLAIDVHGEQKVGLAR